MENSGSYRIWLKKKKKETFQQLHKVNSWRSRVDNCFIRWVDEKKKQIVYKQHRWGADDDVDNGDDNEVDKDVNRNVEML